MRLSSALLALSNGQIPSTFEGLKSQLDPEWIERALKEGGAARLRKRKLAVEDVVWLVIGMALYRNESMEKVVHRLDLVMPKKNGHAGVVSKGAIPPARQRVGEDPLKILFKIVAEHWGRAGGSEERWRGLRVFGADGTTLRVPDSPENRKTFELPKTGRQTSGYPQVRAAVLMDLRSRQWLDFNFGAFSVGEGTVAWPMIQKVPDGSVTILDRFYVDYFQWNRLRAEGKDRHWLVRSRKNMAYKEVKQLGRGDILMEVEYPRALRREHPELEKTFVARQITYQRKGFRARRLVTSLLDSETYPAAEIADLYHERWDLELGYDELKSDLLKNEETIRSRTPDGIFQELWGIAIAYNMVRREMNLVAGSLGLPTWRISFLGSLELMQDLFYWRADGQSPGAIPRHMRRFRKNMQRLALPKRRQDRSYPRHVKIKMSGYLRNNGHPALSRKRDLN